MWTRQLAIVRRSLLGFGILLAACGSSEDTPEADAAGLVPDAGPTYTGALGDASVAASLDAGIALPMDAGLPPIDRRDAAVDAAVPADTCDVTAPTVCPTPAPTYATVAPIFAARCVSCHAASWSGPWPLNTYRHVADWKDDIRSMILACTMPPPEARVPMTREERLAILTWIRCDIPM